MTVIAYREASMECINNNLSDHKLTCKKVLEDYLACLHVHKAKYSKFYHCCDYFVLTIDIVCSMW